MSEAGIGRVLVASLHQSIADLLPARLPFYEHWLNPDGLRHGTIGVAPITAVLSFLRQEGAVEGRAGDAYQAVTARAGELAADWAIEAMTPLRRSLVRGAPVWLRTRLLLRLVGQWVHGSCRDSRAACHLRHGLARVDVRGSLFCAVREPAARPLCGFYAAAFARLMTRFDLPMHVEIATCCGAGGSACVVTLAPVEHARQAAKAA